MSLVPVVYGLFLKSLCDAQINFDTHTFKAMLVGDGYTPNQGTHQYKSSVGGEVSGSGYVAGGMALTGVIANYKQSTKTLSVTAGNLVWPTVTINNIRYCVIYDDTPPTDASKPLVCYIDFNANQSPDEQSFYVTWPTSGVLQLILP